jgi:hypothetical protein
MNTHRGVVIGSGFGGSTGRQPMAPTADAHRRLAAAVEVILST